jgi:hypothetical protein
MYPTYLMQVYTRLWLADAHLDVRERTRAAEARDRTSRHRSLGRIHRQSRP